MDPALAVYRVNFGPDVILRVPDPTNSRSDSSAEHSEAVGPLATSAFAGLEKDEGIVVAGEPLVVLATIMRALVGLHLVGAPGLLVWERRREANCYRGRVASRARWVVDPLEERTLEPAKQRADNAILIAPGSLLAGAETVCLGLQNLALLIGFAVDLLQRNNAQRLVQQSRVLPSCRHL